MKRKNGIKRPLVRRELVESLSLRVGIAITEYRGNLPVIDGIRHKTLQAAYGYLYRAFKKRETRTIPRITTIGKDDPWRNETEWDEMYKDLTDKPEGGTS
jgi:hypothetical protein